MDALFFIIDNISNMIFLAMLIIIIASWVDFFRHRDKRIYFYNRKGALSSTQLEQLRDWIEHMEGREFEEFCEWLFKKTGTYKKVVLTQESNDGGKDLILTDANDEITYVECKRYSGFSTVTEDFMIGREICQKFVGAMTVDGVNKGIIITTGNVHRNAWDYICRIEKNTNLKIDIIQFDEIMRMVEEINEISDLKIVMPY